MKPFFFLCALFSLTTGSSQSRFDSIKLCHDASWRLRSLKLADYYLSFSGSRLQRFSLQDTFIVYDEVQKLLRVQHSSIHNGFFTLKLTDQGVLVEGKSVRFLADTMKPRKPYSLDYATDGDVIASLEGFLFALHFTSNALDVIKFDVGTTTIGIRSGKIEEKYSWDIICESHDHTEEFSLLYGYRQTPQTISVLDLSAGVEAHFTSLKRNGIFNELNSYRIIDYDTRIKQDGYTLQYGESGKLKTKGSRFLLDCK